MEKEQHVSYFSSPSRQARSLPHSQHPPSNSAATAAAGDVAQKIGAVTQDGEGFGILLGEIAGEMGASVGSVVDGSASQPTTSQVTDSVNLSQVAFTRLQAELDDMNGSLETLRQTMSESKTDSLDGLKIILWPLVSLVSVFRKHLLIFSVADICNT